MLDFGLSVLVSLLKFLLGFMVVAVAQMAPKRWLKIFIGIPIFALLLVMNIALYGHWWWLGMIVIMLGVAASLLYDSANEFGNQTVPDIKRMRRCAFLMIFCFIFAIGVVCIEEVVYRNNLGEETLHREEEVYTMEVEEFVRCLVSDEIDADTCNFHYTEREDAEVTKITDTVVRMNNNYFRPREDEISKEVKYSVEVPLEAEKYLSALNNPSS